MKKLHNYSPIWLYLPWWNLGCLGFKFFTFYIDIVCWHSPKGHIYCNWFNKSKWISDIKHPWRWQPSSMDQTWHSLKHIKFNKQELQELNDWYK